MGPLTIHHSTERTSQIQSEETIETRSCASSSKSPCDSGTSHTFLNSETWKPLQQLPERVRNKYRPGTRNAENGKAEKRDQNRMSHFDFARGSCHQPTENEKKNNAAILQNSRCGRGNKDKTEGKLTHILELDYTSRFARVVHIVWTRELKVSYQASKDFVNLATVASSVSNSLSSSLSSSLSCCCCCFCSLSATSHKAELPAHRSLAQIFARRTRRSVS